MPLYPGQEDLDDLVWDRNDEDAEKGQDQLRLKTTCRKVEELAKSKFGATATLVSPLIAGGFNVLYRIHLENTSPDVMVRIPFPALVQFPEEKVIQEAAVASLIGKRRGLPVPRIHHYGEESIVGPYAIMDRIENIGTISARVNKPNDDPSASHNIDPDVSDATLRAIWPQVAHCLLEISQLRFPRIGSLSETADDVYEVTGRPITHNMTDMIRLANIPRSVLPVKGQTYETADAWYTALAEMHMAQLLFQRNDAVVSEADCRNKYVSRQIFRRLAKEGKLSVFGFAEDNWSFQSSSAIPSSTLCPAPSNTEDFRIWGDDFRAGNILLDESDKIAALIDWEFTYVAPTQIILDPPWWLLLETAEMWPSGMASWLDLYSSRLNIWFESMKEAEARSKETTHLPAPLSRYMEESWKTGRYFLSYAARKSWAFDAMYWKFLDERFFGERDQELGDNLWKSRVHLLSDEERAAMEPLVARKMEEIKDRKIVDLDPEQARVELSRFLFD